MIFETYISYLKVCNVHTVLNPSYIGGGADSAPPNGVLLFSRKFFPATYDETLCKFLLYTYEDSHNSFWSKILSREHVEYVYIAWVENANFKNCNLIQQRKHFSN